MRSYAVSRTLALLIANSFLVSSLVLAQQDPREATRPHPVQAGTQSTTPGTTPRDAKAETVPPNRKWSIGGASTITESVIAENESLTASTGGEEPTMRIALAPDVRSATVST